MQPALLLRLARSCEPIYIPKRQASLRWYETTKTGSSFDEQFRENHAVARRHAPKRGWLLLWKRMKTMRTIAIYRGVWLFRSGVRKER